MSEETRRRDSVATRQALLDAATALFAERGYDRTTVRDIATRAGANQALLFRYFGSKEALFAEVAAGHRREETEPGLLVAEMLDNLLDPSSSARRDQVLTALLRTLGTDDEAAAIRERLNASYAETLGTLTDQPDAALRADLVLAWLFGISLMRGVAATQPLADADPAAVRDLVLPAARTLLEKMS
ncbi:TetR/AcrR family transcriptional regulator [Actinophytocola algeriensis]|uniref:AcrR family transcriptional regulator n=1 Tax=Actinophytocola algeriensis TaxID=1768010 RepID=A0A7W7PZU7_9PSEU|nr:TetR family transcriptional regulator [Actinophytocola algeriensis]MBB4904359.1 AcrR family transcriptional regulator [Actinophytocola algeriensis]MBE1476783.1 AcrR family transcriptional regulator [Actinophytocola algeriensis]